MNKFYAACCLLILIFIFIYRIPPSKDEIPIELPINNEIDGPHLNLIMNGTDTKNIAGLNYEDSFSNSTVLLIYVYANTHQYAYGNLKYFIDKAVRESDGVDYIFILQQMQDKEINETEMPPLPKTNAIYIQHENRCFHIGTIGWFFEKYAVSDLWTHYASLKAGSNHHNARRLQFRLEHYRYFIFMNSSIRGPFLPPYFLKLLSNSQKESKNPFYWYHIFTKRINDKVKLVGCTISCEGSPHVETSFLTTDFIGLSILLRAGGNDGIPRSGFFGCYASQSDAGSITEIPISTRILQSDYSIDSLLTKYQTIDFSKKANYQSTVSGSPYVNKKMDGTSLEPYEVVFVKYNDKDYTSDARERAKLYEQWMQGGIYQNRQWL